MFGPNGTSYSAIRAENYPSRYRKGADILQSSARLRGRGSNGRSDYGYFSFFFGIYRSVIVPSNISAACAIVSDKVG